MESSQFSNRIPNDALERIERHGATCDTYRVKLYGKLHFLKRLKADYANDIRYREAFHKEFETGYSLEHPHLVRYISQTDDGILMEYVDGETLAECIARHPQYFTRKTSDKLLHQLLDVVKYLHAHQVLHLDLKPDNILITRINDDVKLVDLGSCYTDTFVDTQGYTDSFSAPEQIGNGTVDERTDIYAIGKILETLPNAFIYNKVIERCTANNPAERYQSIDEILQAISKRRVSPYLLLLLIPIIAITFLFYSPKQHQPDEIVDTPATPQPTAQETPAVKPETSSAKQAPSFKPQVPAKSTVPAKEDSMEQLRSDIQQLVLPAFQSTLGAVDHPSQNSQLWNEAMQQYIASEQQRMEQIVRSHPEIPMDVVVTEYRNYVQSLITMAANK